MASFETVVRVPSSAQKLRVEFAARQDSCTCEGGCLGWKKEAKRHTSLAVRNAASSPPGPRSHCAFKPGGRVRLKLLFFATLKYALALP